MLLIISFVSFLISEHFTVDVLQYWLERRQCKEFLRGLDIVSSWRN